MRRLISNVTLVLPLLIALLYYGPLLKYRWVPSILVELFPYLSAVALLGCATILFIPKLRTQPARLGLAAFLLVLCWAPVLNWIGLPKLGGVPEGIRVMTYNLWIDNADAESIAQSIQQEDPAILFLSEVSQAMMDELRSRLDYPYRYRTTGGNNALFTRYPILEVSTDELGVTTLGRTLNLIAKLQIESEVVTLIGVHPPIPFPPKFFHIRNQQLDSLAKVSRDLSGKVIILGDFNATPWSPYLQRFERRSQLNNVSRGHGIWSTWHVRPTIKHFIQVPLDHIEIRGFKTLKTWTGRSGGSDHKPIITVLQALSERQRDK